MDDQQWRTIKARIFRTFPSLATWARGLSKEQGQAIGQRWQRSLIRYEAGDVNDTIDDMAQRPESPWPKSWDMERAGAIIAAETGDRISRRQEAAKSSASSLPKRPTNYVATGIYSRVMAAIAADGRHTPECVSYRAERGRCHPSCPVPRLVGLELSRDESGLAEDRQAFGCPLCRDSGSVSCLKACDISETVRTGRVPRVRRTYSLPCTCSRGDVVLRQNEAVGKRDVYDASRDVRSDVPDAEIVTQCRALVESEGGRRVESFDAWNSA